MSFRDTAMRLHAYRADLVSVSRYVILIVAMSAVILLKIIIPLTVASFIDRALSGGGVNPVSVGALLALFLLEFGLSRFSAHWNYRLSNESMVELQAKVLDHLFVSRWSAVKTYDSVYLTQRINNDSVTVTDTLIEQFPAFLLAIIEVLLCVVSLSVLSPLLGVIGALSVLIFYLGYAFYRHRYQQFNHAMIESQAEYFKTLGGQLGQGLLIRMNNWRPAALERFTASGKDFVAKSVRFLDTDFAISNVGSLVARGASISFVLAFGALGPSVIPIAAVVSGLMLLQVLVGACQGTLAGGKAMSRFLVSEQRLEQLRALPKEPHGEIEVSRIDHLSLNHVSFAFDERPLFSDVQLDLQPGIHCVTGPNGTGKSTLLHLIAGIYEPTVGDIRLGELPLSAINLEKLRGESLGYVEQAPYLFQGSVFENLVFGNSREDLETAVEPLLDNILDFVPQLPDGLASDVGVDGSRLSGGQKQRISIARAVLKKPRVLMMDEPSAALDASGREALIHLLTSLEHETIVIMVTHDRELLDRFTSTLQL